MLERLATSAEETRVGCPDSSLTSTTTCRRVPRTARDSAVCSARTDSSGYSPGRDYEYVEINRVLRSMHADVVAEAIKAIERLGGTVRTDPTTDLMTVNDEFTASIVISRSCQTAEWRSSMEDSPRHRPAARHHCRDPNGRGQPRSVRLLPAAPHRHLDGEAATEGRERVLSWTRTVSTHSIRSSTWRHALRVRMAS